MQNRRAAIFRLLLILSGVLLAWVIAIQLRGNREATELSLRFCGFTNTPGLSLTTPKPFFQFIQVQNPTNAAPWTPEEAILKWQGKTGLFRLTNKGRGTVWLMSWGEYVGQDRPLGISRRDLPIIPLGSAFLKTPAYLRPGQSVLLPIAEPYEGGEKWGLGLSYYSAPPREKLRKLCGESRLLVYGLYFLPPPPRSERVFSDIVSRSDPNPFEREKEALLKSGELVELTIDVPELQSDWKLVNERVGKAFQERGRFYSVSYDHVRKRVSVTCFKDDVADILAKLRDR